jgi:hypothetical protein
MHPRSPSENIGFTGHSSYLTNILCILMVPSLKIVFTMFTPRTGFFKMVPFRL